MPEKKALPDPPSPPLATAHLGDLIPDPRNARRHTPRNIGMIARSLSEVGAARSIVITEENVVLAGNATVEAAAEIGLEDVLIIEAEGDELVAVRRRNLTPEQQARLALLDNRSGELAEWEPAILAALAREVPMQDLFTPDELAAFTQERAIFAPTIAPVIDTTQIAEADVDYAREQLDGWFGQHEHEYVQVACEHCQGIVLIHKGLLEEDAQWNP